MKDPFANLPKIDHDEADASDALHGEKPTSDHVDSPEDVTAGAPPRTILKTLSKWAVPVFGVAIGIWLFLPEDQTVMQRPAQAPVSVDTEKQANDSLAATERLKSEASKRPPAAVPVMPGSPSASTALTASQATGQAALTNQPPAGYSPSQPVRPPLPPSYGGHASATPPPPTAGMDEKQQAVYQAYLDRQQEIRSSAIEVSKVRLVSDSSKSAAAPQSLIGLQSEVSAETERSAAMRAQQDLQEKMFAAMAPKEHVKSRGANEDFLATNAATANSAAGLTRQMKAQATSLVSEGHVIRGVLLTKVESDLPGRVLARVTSDVYDSQMRYVVIPKGSVITGVYSTQVAVGQQRLLMAMNRLVLPNGNWISLSGAPAADMLGVSGMKAEVNNHFMKMFGSSLVIGASSLLLPRADATVSTVPGIGGNGGSGTAGSVFATSLNDVIKSLLERNRQIPPTLTLNAGDEFVFMVTQDMAMVPYSQ